MQLFNECDKDVQKIISEVLDFEQENISKDRPHFREAIKEIIDRVVKDEA